MAYTTIDDPEAYFQIAEWTGNATNRSITLPGDTDMQPDMVLIKEYSSSDENSWRLADSARGVSSKWLATNTEDAEGTSASIVTALNSDGFSIGTAAAVNSTGDSCIGYCWKESATAGFDMTTWSGTGSAKTESHSLSAVPHIILVKQRDDPGGGSNSWNMYHHKNTSAPETDYLVLNDSDATADSNLRWNDTAPTSSVFTVGTGNTTNQSSSSYVGYLWTGIQGFSKFGGYDANNNVDGPYIHLGFKPAFLLIKESNNADAWILWDNKRDPYNETQKTLVPNNVNAQDTNTTNDDVDFLANGFKIRCTSYINNSGGKYVYMAFAEAPFVNSNGVPCNAR